MNEFVGRRFISSSIAALLIWVFVVGMAAAQEPVGTTLALDLPTASAAGQAITVSARLTREAGAAVGGAEVVFLRDAQFMNAASELLLGKASTDNQGMATLTFVPRSEGELLIFADFAGDALYGASGDSKSLMIEAGPQLYVEEAGIKVPGVNVFLLVAILGGVWGTYFLVMARVWFIARDGVSSSSTSRGVS